MAKPILLSLFPVVPVFADHQAGTTIELPAGFPAKSDPARLTKSGFKASFNEKDLTDTVNKTGHHPCDLSGVHLLILDACYNSKMESYGRNNARWHGSNLPPAQIEWLKKELAATHKATVVFIHQRLDLDRPNHYAVKQSAEVRKILENSKKVKTVFQGHSHKNELTEIKGIPYYTLAARVEGSGVENNSYSLLHVQEDGTLKLESFRRLVSRTFTS